MISDSPIKSNDPINAVVENLTTLDSFIKELPKKFLAEKNITNLIMLIENLMNSAQLKSINQNEIKSEEKSQGQDEMKLMDKSLPYFVIDNEEIKDYIRQNIPQVLEKVIDSFNKKISNDLNKVQFDQAYKNLRKMFLIINKFGKHFEKNILKNKLDILDKFVETAIDYFEVKIYSENDIINNDCLEYYEYYKNFTDLKFNDLRVLLLSLDELEIEKLKKETENKKQKRQYYLRILISKLEETIKKDIQLPDYELARNKLDLFGKFIFQLEDDKYAKIMQMKQMYFSRMNKFINTSDINFLDEMKKIFLLIGGNFQEIWEDFLYFIYSLDEDLWVNNSAQQRQKEERKTESDNNNAMGGNNKISKEEFIKQIEENYFNVFVERIKALIGLDKSNKLDNHDYYQAKKIIAKLMEHCTGNDAQELAKIDYQFIKNSESKFDNNNFENLTFVNPKLLEALNKYEKKENVDDIKKNHGVGSVENLIDMGLNSSQRDSPGSFNTRKNMIALKVVNLCGQSYSNNQAAEAFFELSWHYCSVVDPFSALLCFKKSVSLCPPTLKSVGFIACCLDKIIEILIQKEKYFAALKADAMLRNIKNLKIYRERVKGKKEFNIPDNDRRGQIYLALSAQATKQGKHVEAANFSLLAKKYKSSSFFKKRGNTISGFFCKKQPLSRQGDNNKTEGLPRPQHQRSKSN